MKRRSLIAFLIAMTLLFVVAACNEQPVLPAAEEEAQTAAQTENNGSAVSQAEAVSEAAAITTQNLSGSPFESHDGNLVVNTGGNIDWNSFADQATAEAFNFGSQPDAASSSTDDQYAGGMKHDNECPALTTGNVHVKSDFSGFYIAHHETAAGTFLYLAWQRVPQNNDTNSAHASFIFAQAEELCPNGTTPVRTHGDMLVTYDFQGGTTGVATIGLSRWIVAGEINPSTGNLSVAADCETSKSLPCWNKVVNLNAQGFGEGSVNHRGVGPVYDAIQDTTLGVVQFGEAAINLTAAGVFTDDNCVQFGSVHVGSRASGNSFDAQLKDLIAPLGIELTNCAGLTIVKKDDAGNPLSGVTFTLHEDDNGAVGAATTFFCTTSGTGVCTIDDIFVGTYWVVETNLPAGHDPDPDLPYLLVITEDDVDSTIELTFVNPRQLLKVIVLVCYESDNTLVASNVAEGENDPIESTASGANNESILCSLTTSEEGAVFTGYVIGDEVNLTVNVGETD